jgi:hypothetical protein
LINVSNYRIDFGEGSDTFGQAQGTASENFQVLAFKAVWEGDCDVSL